jgi:hypothetical protein
MLAMETDPDVFMFYMVACRKVCDLPIENEFVKYPEAMADSRMHLIYIPEESIDVLQQRVDQNDTNAMLSLADCLMFGLKGAEKNPRKARELYQRAADLNNYEAVSQLAVLAKHENSNSYGPINKYLEKAVAGGYIPQLLIYFVEDAMKRNRINDVSEKVLVAYNERCKAFNMEYFENAGPRGNIACDNQGCDTRASNESVFFRCCNCKAAKYCSKVCQTADWNRRHRKECRTLRATHPNVIQGNFFYSYLQINLCLV